MEETTTEEVLNTYHGALGMRQEDRQAPDLESVEGELPESEELKEAEV